MHLLFVYYKLYYFIYYTLYNTIFIVYGILITTLCHFPISPIHTTSSNRSFFHAHVYLLGDKLSLTRVICVTMHLDLSVGD